MSCVDQVLGKIAYPALVGVQRAASGDRGRVDLLIGRPRVQPKDLERSVMGPGSVSRFRLRSPGRLSRSGPHAQRKT